jgi:hypothetical protein
MLAFFTTITGKHSKKIHAGKHALQASTAEANKHICLNDVHHKN